MLAALGTHPQRSKPPAADPHSQPHPPRALTTRSPTADRRDLRHALDAQSAHSHSRNRLGRHHLVTSPGSTESAHAETRLGIDIRNGAFMEHPLGKVLASTVRVRPADRSQDPRARSATPTASPTPAASPPTPGSHPSTGNQAPGVQHHPKTPRRQPPTQKRHVPSRVRRLPTRPRRPRLLPTKTSRRQTPQRRRHLRRPQTLRHHLSHAQNPNPLPTNTTPTPTPSRLKRLDNKTGHPPRLGEFLHRSPSLVSPD